MSASCSCLAAEKNMTLAQATRTVASTVASLEKIRSSDNEWNQIWKEVGQLERVAEIRADVAQPNEPILQQSESMDRRCRQI